MRTERTVSLVQRIILVGALLGCLAGHPALAQTNIVPPNTPAPAAMTDGEKDELFQRSCTLSTRGNADEAIESFRRYISLFPSNHVGADFAESYAWIGQMEFRKSHFVEGEVATVRAIALMDQAFALGKYSSQYSPEAYYLNHKVRCYGTLISAYWDRGMLGKCRSLLDEVAASAERLSKLTQEGTDHEQALRHLVQGERFAKWNREDLEGRFFDASGQQRKYVAALRGMIAEIESVSGTMQLSTPNVWQLLCLRSILAGELREIGYEEEAEQIYSRAATSADFPAFRRFENDRAVVQANLAELHVLLHGDKPEYFESARIAEQTVVNHPRPTSITLVSRSMARMHASVGRNADAMRLINVAIDKARGAGTVQFLPRTRLVRAQIYLATDKPKEAAADLLEALRLTRASGFKAPESHLYQYYGRAEAMQGLNREAFLVWEEAIAVASQTDRPYVALDTLCDVLELHMKLGNVDESLLMWQRIEALLQANPDIQPRWRSRVNKLRPQYVAFAKDHAPAGPAPVASTPNSSSSAINGNVVASGGTTTGTLLEPAAGGSVILQPSTVETRALPGETVRTWFELHNTAPVTKTGEVVLAGDALDFAWVCTDEVARATIVCGNQAGPVSKSLPISLNPAQGMMLLMEAANVVTDAVRVIKVGWRDASTTNDCVWNIGPDLHSRVVSVADASCIEENGFFHVPFSHEVVCRGTGTNIVDIKVEASQPCRIEIYEDDTETALAIDASGDGRLDGVGDIYSVDRNHNGIPDVEVGGEKKSAHLEIWAYPFSLPQGYENGDLDIAVFTRQQGTNWDLQAVDTLTRKK